MRIAAIVCEYNPFHNGHKKQFAQIRQRFGPDTAILCLMSGNFVQRGEPAIFPKNVRAEAAIRCGANLVLELPVTCALSSAEGFADGAIQMLNRLGFVDFLCFGAESGQLEPLWQTAMILRSDLFSEALRHQLEKKISFAAARSQALQQLGAAPELVRCPNDILAVEYCKALQNQKSNIAPAVFSRRGDYHAAQPAKEDPSATSLRALPILSDWLPYIPAEAAAVYRKNPLQYRLLYGERAMLAVLRHMPDEAFARLPYGTEGLWRRFQRASRQACSVTELIDAVKSKRYARSRIARMCMCAYLGLDQAQLALEPPYLRVLAMDDTGRTLLRQAHACSRIPLIQTGQRVRQAYFELETRVSNLYAMFAPPDASIYADGERHGKIFYQK